MLCLRRASLTSNLAGNRLHLAKSPERRRRDSQSWHESIKKPIWWNIFTVLYWTFKNRPIKHETIEKNLRNESFFTSLLFRLFLTLTRFCSWWWKRKIVNTFCYSWSYVLRSAPKVQLRSNLTVALRLSVRVPPYLRENTWSNVNNSLPTDCMSYLREMARGHKWE